MNIALVFGSQSVEHEISVLTAMKIYAHLKDNFNVTLLYIDKEMDFYHFKEVESNMLKEISRYCKKQVVLKKGGYINKYKVDLFIPVLHGTNGEDGKIQGMLDMLDCKYLSHSMYSSICGHSKYLSKLILRDNNIQVLDYYRVLKKDLLENTMYVLNRISRLGYPVILKGTSLGSSVGIVKIEREDDIFDALLRLFTYDNEIIVEHCISDFIEVNQAVVFTDDFNVSNIELVNNTNNIYDYDEKYCSYRKHKLILLEDEQLIKRISEISKKVYQMFNFSSIVRIDYLIKEDNIYVNEINVIPGSLAVHLFDKSIVDIITELLSLNIQKLNYNYKNSFNLSLANSKKF